MISTALQTFLILLGQFICVGYLMISGKVIPSGWISEILFGSGLLFGFASFVSIPSRQSRISPFPAPECTLITSGPYAVVRHPMYISMLAMTLGWVVMSPTPDRLTVWGILIGILLVTIQIEERLLRLRFPEYEAYMERTRCLIPFIY